MTWRRRTGRSPPRLGKSTTGPMPTARARTGTAASRASTSPTCGPCRTGAGSARSGARTRSHPDYHIAVDRHFYSVPYQYVGKEVDVRLRGQVIDVFHRGRQIASHLRSQAKGRATTLKEHQPQAHQRAGVEGSRDRLERDARDIGPHVHAFVVAVMERNRNPEFGFRSCYGVLRLANGHEPERFDAACRYALELGTRTYRGLDNILLRRLRRAAARRPGRHDRPRRRVRAHGTRDARSRRHRGRRPASRRTRHRVACRDPLETVVPPAVSS